MPSLATISSSKEERHVAVFPFPSTSKSNPCALFNLVINLANAAPNIQFSFFASSKSNQSIKLPNIRTYFLNYGAESLDEKMVLMVPENFKKSVNAAETELGKRITCFITDSFFCLPVCEMAQHMNIPWIALWVAAPFSLPPFFHWDLLHLFYIKAEAYQIGEQILNSSPICQKLFEKDSIIEPIESICLNSKQTLNQVISIVMNSYQELNSDIFAYYFKPKFQKLLYLGALSNSWPGEDCNGCLSWLDRQKPRSVIYVCLGTGVGFPLEEIMPLAEALELSGFPFLWAMIDDWKDHLPEGFLEKKRGKVVSWVPQNQVLKHPSVGVYVTHCGYNSVFESILGGVPMICRSVWADNHIISNMIEQVWGNGIRVEGGKTTKSEMIKCLESIFLHEKGKNIRENANSLKQVVLKKVTSNDAIAQDFKTLVQIISTE